MTIGDYFVAIRTGNLFRLMTVSADGQCGHLRQIGDQEVIVNFQSGLPAGVEPIELPPVTKEEFEKTIK